jgi:predicted dehydrogenase
MEGNRAASGRHILRLGVHTLDQIISLFGRPDHVSYDIRSLRNKANPDDTFEAQLFYGNLKAIVKTSHLVKLPTQNSSSMVIKVRLLNTVSTSRRPA